MTELLPLISQAKAGDMDAMQKLIEHYMPLIVRNSMEDELQINEDCQQYLIFELIRSIKKFQPDYQRTSR